MLPPKPTCVRIRYAHHLYGDTRLCGADAGSAACSAAQRLVGRHDFTTFRSVQCQANSPVRSLDRLDVIEGDTDGLIEIHASARSFLHNQIRSFAGTLRLVGEHKWSADDVEAALAARSRKACGPVAAPWGLYFRAVDYPDDTVPRPDEQPGTGVSGKS